MNTRETFFVWVGGALFWVVSEDGCLRYHGNKGEFVVESTKKPLPKPRKRT